ncbi:MAG: SEC-C metal-binding domain-containing protein [Acidimicrobiia bacterium]
MDLDEHLRAIAAEETEDGRTSFVGLLERCLAETSLADGAAAEGFTPEEYLIWTLEADDQLLVREKKDLVVRYGDLLDGLVLTHRLDEDEIRTGLVSATPDLVGIEIDLDPIPLAAGGTARLEFNHGDETRFHDQGSFEGPSGWLDGFSAGDLVAFVRVGDALNLEAVAEVGDPAEEVAALSAAFTGLFDRPGIGAEPSEILLEAIIEHPDLFRRPVLPLGELLGRAGLEVRGAWAGPTGEEWKPPGVARLDALTREMEIAYRMESCCAAAFREATDHWRDPNAVDSVVAAKALGHGVVADAFLNWYDTLLDIESPRFGDYLRDLIAASGRHAGPVRYLYAVHLDTIGEATAAETELDTALRLDPDFGPAAWMLAEYSSVRGDVARTISLLQRAGVGPDDDAFEYYRSLLAEVPRVGRNDPCPCGSGRKFKVCHLNRPEVSPKKRVGWMLRKVANYMRFHWRHHRYTELAVVAAVANLGERFDGDGVLEMAEDQFIFDLEMFEGGGVADFLAERWEMIPADERDVYELWAQATLALWEVISVGDGSIELRDTLTGDTVEVSDRSAASAFQAGDYLLARPLLGFGSAWFPAVVIPVDLHHRESLLELFSDQWDAWDVAHWYGSTLRPPTFQNYDSEPLVMCEASMEPAGSWEELEARLDELYERDVEGAWVSFAEGGPAGSFIRATLDRKGDRLSVSTNSVERLDRVLDALGDEVSLVERREEEIDWETLGQGPTPETPEVPQELVDQIAEKMEDWWLEESVPALGGITPREAATDPTRREDLESLLRSFEQMQGPGSAMRASSLRRKLGLGDG